MKRFLTNLILVISILSILVIPSFAATTSDSDDIVILKQPSDTFFKSYNDSTDIASFSIVVIGDVASYLWQYSDDGENFNNLNSDWTSSYNSPDLTIRIPKNLDARYFRCKITSTAGNVIYSRVAFGEVAPTNIFNFIGSCLRYITSYISLIVNSLVTPGAPLYALLPVLCIGIAVAVLLIVIKITKGFSWGM